MDRPCIAAMHSRTNVLDIRSSGAPDREQLRRRVLRALDGQELDDDLKQDVAQRVADFLEPDIRSAYSAPDELNHLREELDLRFPEVAANIKRANSGTDRSW